MQLSKTKKERRPSIRAFSTFTAVSFDAQGRARELDTQFCLDLSFELRDKRGFKFDHGAAANAGEMIVLRFRSRLEMPVPVVLRKIGRGDEPGFF